MKTLLFSALFFAATLPLASAAETVSSYVKIFNDTMISNIEESINEYAKSNNVEIKNCSLTITKRGELIAVVTFSQKK